MPFDLHDHVRVKPGVLLAETGEEVPNWHGEIMELPSEWSNELLYMIELDAISLGQIPEQFLANSKDTEAIPFVHYFYEHELELAPRRDTTEERKKALTELENLLGYSYENEHEYELDITPVKRWYSGFEKSPLFEGLPPESQQEAWLMVEAFSVWAHYYTLEQPEEWSTDMTEEVCFSILPAKFSGDVAFFTHFKVVIPAFFQYLEQENLHKNATELRETMGLIMPQMIHNLEKRGVQDRRIPEKKPTNRPAKPNNFKNLSRNQIITVLYPDGTTRQGKFKRLEEELRSGKCTLQ